MDLTKQGVNSMLQDDTVLYSLVEALRYFCNSGINHNQKLVKLKMTEQLKWH